MSASHEDLGIEAVVLAGGRGRRMGGTDKAAIRLDGARLVDRVVQAARGAGAHRVIVVGPDPVSAGASVVVREDPPFSGPLAALAAAIPQVRAESMLLLSCDLVWPDQVCERLTARRLDASVDGAVLRDETGWAQWLAGLYRTERLRAGIRALDSDVENASLRTLLGPLRLEWLDSPTELIADIDDPEDLACARRALDSASRVTSHPSDPDR